jgi:hypothetical protein
MMNWWKGFKDWLTAGPEYSVLKDWEPSNILYLPTAPQEPAGWSAKPLIGTGETTIPPISGSPTSETVSDEKNEPGEETMTILEHADDLPSSTFRVFPNASNHRNSYDSPASVVRAVAVRRRWYGPFNYRPKELGGEDPIRVYQAETVWRDVTEEYVK